MGNLMWLEREKPIKSLRIYKVFLVEKVAKKGLTPISRFKRTIEEIKIKYILFRLCYLVKTELIYFLKKLLSYLD